MEPTASGVAADPPGSPEHPAGRGEEQPVWEGREVVPTGTPPRLVFAERRVPPIRPDREHSVALPDGRRLGAAEFGRRSGVPIVYLHGLFGSRIEPGAIERRFVNIIGLDRPGYGGTDLQPRRSLAAFGRDVRAGLDALGIGRCVVVGASSGAPFAIAAAAALGPRALRLVLVAGVGGPEVLMRAGGAAEVIVRLAGEGWGGGRLLRNGFRLARSTGLDRTLLGTAVRDEAASLARHGLSAAFVHERLLQSMRMGNGRLMRGAVADARLLTRPWDVDPGTLATETLVLHGDDDPAVPVEHAAWYAGRMPRARVEIVPGERHLSLCFGSTDRVQHLARELTGAA
jgi:pimeloyl-ACP methyl ester carboxylesterase